MVYVKVKRKKHIKINTDIGPKMPIVKVGYPSGKVDSDIVARAIWNHYGTSGGGFGGPIPARPFLFNAVRSNKNKYLRAMKVSAKKIFRDETSVKNVLEKLGIVAQGDVQKEITSLSSPPNSPVTIARKGSSNPLIDTGEMRQRTTYEVVA